MQSSVYQIIFQQDEHLKFRDAFMELTQNHKFSTLMIYTENNKFNPLNKILLNKYVFSADSDITFDESKLECYINYSIIKFDSNSSSAYTDFMQNINKVLNTENQIIKYPSGNIMLIGDVTNINSVKCINGTGTLFYDLPFSRIKYTGEFENGLYDGAGTFYSLDGNITINVPNISKGIPILRGELHIKYPTYDEIYDVNFYDLWDKQNLVTAESKREYVLSDNFVDEFAKTVWQHEKTLEDFKFDVLTVNEKFNILNAKIKYLEGKLINHKKAINNIEDDNIKYLFIILVPLMIVLCCTVFSMFNCKFY